MQSISFFSVTKICEQHCRGLKKYAGQERCNFLTDSWKFPTEEIMGAQNFNFAPKFPQMGVSNPKFCIFGEKFLDEEHFPTSNSSNFLLGGAISPTDPLPQCHCLWALMYCIISDYQKCTQAEHGSELCYLWCMVMICFNVILAEKSCVSSSIMMSLSGW